MVPVSQTPLPATPPTLRTLPGGKQNTCTVVSRTPVCHVRVLMLPVFDAQSCTIGLPDKHIAKLGSARVASTIARHRPETMNIGKKHMNLEGGEFGEGRFEEEEEGGGGGGGL